MEALTATMRCGTRCKKDLKEGLPYGEGNIFPNEGDLT